MSDPPRGGEASANRRRRNHAGKLGTPARQRAVGPQGLPNHGERPPSEGTEKGSHDSLAWPRQAEMSFLCAQLEKNFFDPEVLEP